MELQTRVVRVSGVVLCALSAVACAGTEVPRARLAATQAALRSADELGANNVPKAQLHVQLAQENVDRAENLIDAGDNEGATYALMRAQSDAELALTLAREVPAQKDAQAALDRVSKMRATLRDDHGNKAPADEK